MVGVSVCTQPRGIVERRLIVDVLQIVEIQPFGTAVHDIGDAEPVKQHTRRSAGRGDDT